jgi:hypothetical protein
MKLKFDSFVSSQFKHPIHFDTKTGILSYQTKTGILSYQTKKPLPDQRKNLMKLNRILDNHPDNDDYGRIVYLDEIKEIQKAIKSETIHLKVHEKN